jgi:hypothetical protein
MKRIVRSGTKLAAFDDERGEVVEWLNAGVRANGIVSSVGGKWVALYADEGELVLQIGLDRFPLPTSQLTYEHNWNDGTTTFGAASGERAASVTYAAWWAEAGVDPWQVRAVPERDEEEDNLAWIARSLPSDASERRRVLSDWEARLEDYPTAALVAHENTSGGTSFYSIERQQEDAPLVLVREVVQEEDALRVDYERVDSRMPSEVARVLIAAVLLDNFLQGRFRGKVQRVVYRGADGKVASAPYPDVGLR